MHYYIPAKTFVAEALLTHLNTEKKFQDLHSNRIQYKSDSWHLAKPDLKGDYI